VNEFGIINHYFKQLCQQHTLLKLGIGDDAAVIEVPVDNHLAISTDALVSGVHFLPDWDAFDIAYKAMAVNISDMAAMGAIPKWVSIALCLPKPDTAWLERFYLGLKTLLERFNVSLIGGDLTKGPLTISVTIQGLVPKNQFLTRHGALPGDSVYVTGFLGAAGFAVNNLVDNRLAAEDFEQVVDKLKHPEPRVEHGQALLNLASAAIDISDGLAQDLNHICTASGVAARLDKSALPIDALVCAYLKEDAFDFALGSGDDYELCFTVSEDNCLVLEKKLSSLGFNYHKIGEIEEGEGIRIIDEEGNSRSIMPKGYQHF